MIDTKARITHTPTPLRRPRASVHALEELTHQVPSKRRLLDILIPSKSHQRLYLPLTANTHLGTILLTANDEHIARVLMSHLLPGYSHPHSPCRVLTRRVRTLTRVRQ